MSIRRFLHYFPAFAVILVFFAVDIKNISAAGVDYKVPFTTQAPFGNWSYPYQGYCEEASVVMAAHFLWNLPISASFADLEMNIIRQYEEFRWKRYDDTNAYETSEFMQAIYGINNTEVVEIFSAADLVNYLNKGNIILAPTAGRLLNNPHYTGLGPVYHMLVVRGYDSDKQEFIVNDPGFLKGNGYKFSYDILFNAIHDWNNGDVLNGAKNVIVVPIK